MGCGHSSFSSTPIRYCANARAVDTMESTELEDVEREAEAEPVVAEVAVRSRVDSVMGADSKRQSRESEAGMRELAAHPLPSSTSQHNDDDDDESLRSALNHRLTPKLQPCDKILAHPLHTVKVGSTCAVCVYEKAERLRILESSTDQVRFEPWRWQWKYKGGDAGRPPKVVPKAQQDRASNAAAVISGAWATGSGYLKDWQRSSNNVKP